MKARNSVSDPGFGKAIFRVWKVWESVPGLWCGTAEFRSGTVSLESPEFGFGPLVCNKQQSFDLGPEVWQALNLVSDPGFGKAVFRSGTLSLERPGMGVGPLVWTAEFRSETLSLERSGVGFGTLVWKNRAPTQDRRSCPTARSQFLTPGVCV